MHIVIIHRTFSFFLIVYPGMEAIVVIIKSGVHNEKSWALVCRYTRVDGKFEFGPVEEEPGATMEMIPDWKESTTD